MQGSNIDRKYGKRVLEKVRDKTQKWVHFKKGVQH
jgi:hypothetical protein